MKPNWAGIEEDTCPQGINIIRLLSVVALPIEEMALSAPWTRLALSVPRNGPRFEQNAPYCRYSDDVNAICH